MWDPQRITIDTQDPEGVAIRTMANAANQSADTFTMREWAARLATKAPPRDYVGQLGKLYDGIVDRWRYIMEDGEWLDGSPRTLLGHTLGTKYNQGPTCRSPEDCDVEGTEWKEKGWGDCDSVASLAMAGVITLGMVPFFRTVRWPGQGAHVSVVAVTPRGETVSIDPVAYPEHPFGWAAPGPMVRYFDRMGNLAPNLDAQLGMGTTMYNNPCNYQGFGHVAQPGLEPTYLGDIEGMTHQLDSPHVVAVPFGDVKGPRIFAIPEYHGRVMARGLVLDGCPAVSQYGELYEYDGDTDVWVPAPDARSPYANHAGYGAFRGRRSRRRVARAARRQARGPVRAQRRAVRRKRTKRFFRRVGGFLRKHGATIAAVAPIPGGRALATGIRAAQFARKAARGGAFSGYQTHANTMGHTMAEYGAFGNIDRSPAHIDQNGVVFAAQPVMAFGAVPGMYEFGALEVAAAPTPGNWYRVKRRESLLKVAGQAFGLGSGRERLKAARWINNAVANQPYVDPSLADNLFRDGRISFRPRYACDPEHAILGHPGSCYALIWIPPAEGVEPPAEAPEIAITAARPVRVTEPEPEPEPPTVAPTPAPEPEVVPLPEPPTPVEVLPVEPAVVPEPEPEPEPPPPEPPVEVVAAPEEPPAPEPPPVEPEEVTPEPELSPSPMEPVVPDEEGVAVLPTVPTGIPEWLGPPGDRLRDMPPWVRPQVPPPVMPPPEVVPPDMVAVTPPPVYVPPPVTPPPMLPPPMLPPPVMPPSMPVPPPVAMPGAPPGAPGPGVGLATLIMLIGGM